MAGIMIPLYTDPSDASWNTMIAAKNAHPNVPMVVIANPNSGPGEAYQISAYTDGINRCHAANIKVIGYVAIEKPITDADLWKSRYPGLLDGIFIDEFHGGYPIGTPGENDDSYAAHVRSLGYNFIVGNPGMNTHTNYTNVDVVCGYENPSYPSLQEVAGIVSTVGSPSRAYVLVYNQPFNATFFAQQTAGWIYTTNGSWGGIASYFMQEVAALDGGGPPPPPTSGKIIVTTNPTPANITIVRRT